MAEAWRSRSAPLSDLLPAPEPEETQELEAMMALPRKDRLALHLFYYEEYSTAQIARITGEKEGTVRSRLSRARERLRVLLKSPDLDNK